MTANCVWSAVWRWVICAMCSCFVLLYSAVVLAEEGQKRDSAQTLFELERTGQDYSLSRRGEVDVQIGEHEDLRLFLGLHTVGRLQALFQDDVVVTDFEEDPPQEMPAQQRFIGFQNAWGNLRLLADYDERIEVFFDLYLASRPNPATTYGHEGYILVHRAPAWLEETFAGPVLDYISVKAGQFEADFGDHRYRRSDNARVQNNPLIGNYVVDPKVTEVGAEVFADRRRFNWLVGIGSGTVTEALQEGTGTSAHLKIWGYPLEQLRLSVSGYWVDHSDNLTGFPEDGAAANLFSGYRSGGTYAGVVGGGDDPGGLQLGNGQHVLANQADLSARLGPVELYGHFGVQQDFDTTGAGEGTPTERWHYQATEAVVGLGERAHVATRYSGARALTLDDEQSSGKVDRIQLGAGFEAARGLLFKFEYVTQFHRDFVEEDGQIEGVDMWREPWFHGVLLEASYAF